MVKRNQLLRTYLYDELGEEPEQTFPWLTFVLATLLFLLLGWVVYWVIG